MAQFTNDGLPRRKAYSKVFKAQVVAACAQPTSNTWSACSRSTVSMSVRQGIAINVQVQVQVQDGTGTLIKG